MSAVSFLVLGALLTLPFGKQAMPLGKFFKVVDIPQPGGGHKSHLAPTPAVGGIILGIVGAIIFFATQVYNASLNGFMVKLASLFAIVAMMVIGYLDDRRQLSALLRLVLSALIFLILLLLVPEFQVRRVYFQSINFELSLGHFALPFTLLCIVGLKNAINMADGRNGVILGLSLIWCIALLPHAPPLTQAFMYAVIGSLLMLFMLNWYGELFMGDCGSYGIASYFAVLALGLHADAYGTIRTSEIILLFIIPVLDTLRLVILRCRSGRSPFAADNNHLHHLLDQALGWRLGWAVYMALVAVPIILNKMAPVYSFYWIWLACALYGFVALYFSRVRKARGALPAE